MKRLERGGVAGAGLLAFVGAALGYGSQVLVARTSGSNGFGVYSFVLGLSAIAVPWIALDLGASIVRFVPGYASTGDSRTIRRMWRLSWIVVLFTTALTAVGVAATLRWHPPAGVSAFAIWLALLSTALTVLLLLSVQFLTAIGRPATGILLSQVLRPALSAVAVILLFRQPFFSSRLDLLGLSGAVLALILTLLGSSLMLLDAVNEIDSTLGDHQGGAARRDEKIWARYSGTFLFGSIAQTLISQQVDVVIVGSMVATVDAGHYAAAGQIAVAMGILPGVINSILAPRYASAHDRRVGDERETIMRRFTLLLICVSICGVLGVLIVGPFILRMYGTSFEGAFPIALLLSIAVSISSTFGMPASLALSTRGHHRVLNIALVVTAVIAVGLSLLLTSMLGAIGAAWATMTTAALRSLALQLLCRRVERHALAYCAAIGEVRRDPVAVLAEVYPRLRSRVATARHTHE